ncbi:MAG: FAD-binding oxidoreductase, partial [Chitinophagaceae bacterium]
PQLFEARPSLQFASFKSHLPPLAEEHRRRRALGFDVSLLGPGELRDRFGIARPGGLLSMHAAQIDAYALTHALLGGIVERGGAVHEDTEAVSITHRRNGVDVHTSGGHRVRARRLVIACGYESQRYLPKPVEELFVTYALVTKPLRPADLWWRQSLLWETARPYFYGRCGADGRIIIGGRDIRYDGRPYAGSLPGKTRALLAAFRRLMPHLQPEVEGSWAGMFAATADGLPYIGTVPGQPRTWYALGFGGNGILFSMLAARIIAGLITRGQQPDADLFSFDRA